MKNNVNAYEAFVIADSRPGRRHKTHETSEYDTNAMMCNNDRDVENSSGPVFRVWHLQNLVLDEESFPT
jgi:hypothetical protein